MTQKVILIYPYFTGISGAYNRYLLLKRLLEKRKISVKFILFKEKKYNFKLSRIIFKSIRFLKVEFLIFYYSIIKKYSLITDYNPSLIALISKKVYIQIHDIRWENRKYARHAAFFYKILLFFLRNYSNIITVSKTSLEAINKISGRKKNIKYLYNSVSQDYIKASNKIGKSKVFNKKNLLYESINFDLPNIIYIATLSPRKNHIYLLEALSSLKNALNVNLIGYPLDKNIESLIKNKSKLNLKNKTKINYFPKLSQKELSLLLLFSSAYVSTSMNEGFGIPILEANLYKLPLIISDIDIHKELFPKARFFKTKKQLINLLNGTKPLSKDTINKRKKILQEIDEDNLEKSFNYSNLSKDLIKILF